MSTRTKQPVGRPVTKPRPDKPECLDMPVLSGDSIGDASRRAVRLADANKCPVRFIFQGVPLEANPGEEQWDVGDRWFKAQKGKAV